MHTFPNLYFNCSQIFIPVHREIHWCLAIINKKEEKFQYLDSLKGSDNQVTKVLVCLFMTHFTFLTSLWTCAVFIFSETSSSLGAVGLWRFGFHISRDGSRVQAKQWTCYLKKNLKCLVNIKILKNYFNCKEENFEKIINMCGKFCNFLKNRGEIWKKKSILVIL